MMWNSGAAHFHVGAWLVWLVAAMLGALLTRNPVYLGIVIAASLLVNRSLAQTKPYRDEEATAAAPAALMPTQAGTDVRGWGLLMRSVLWLLVAVSLFKALSLHIGATVLVMLPEGWPIIGGPVTAEGLAQAGLDALSLLGVLAVFSAFSAGADYYALLRSVPASMHQVGLITSIAITFVPQTVTRFVEIREAQALRGHRVRRISDLLPIIMPLLAGGMERSMNLAEAMEARGFSRNLEPGTRKLPPIVVQCGLATGLGLIMVGGAFLAFYAPVPVIGWGMIAAGLALGGITLRAVGVRSKRTRYRRGVWRDTDTLLALPALGIAAILLMYNVVTPASLVYDPLSRLRIYMPPFDPVLAFALASLALPAIILRGRRRHASRLIELESYSR